MDTMGLKYRISSMEDVDELAYSLSSLPLAENVEHVIKLTVDEIFDIFSQDFNTFVPFNYKTNKMIFRIELQK